MTDSDFRNEDDAPTADKPRMASILLLALAAGLCLWVLFGTDACTHPIEHLIAAPIAVLVPTAVIMRRLCSDPRFVRWLDELEK